MKVIRQEPSPASHGGRAAWGYSVALIGLGAILFFAPLKFGGTIESVSLDWPPTTFLEWLLTRWPTGMILAGVFLWAAVLLGISKFRLQIANRPWTFWLPAVWLATQILAWPFSIYWQASLDAVSLFAAAVVCFYVAVDAVRGERDLLKLLVCLAGALALVCVMGFEQKFGGLEATQRYAMVYRPDLAGSDLAAKLKGDAQGHRIFATFFYPNSLAGFLALATGPCMALVWMLRARFTVGARWFLVGLLTVAVALSMIWCRSKGGILALALGAVTTLWFLPLSRKQIALGSCAALAVAVAVFVFGYGVHNLDYARSTGSLRIEYARAAGKIFIDHPLVGTGPGTYASIAASYLSDIKHYSRLVHNNFAQMASDSGVLGFVTFAALWTIGLVSVLRRCSQQTAWPLTAGLSCGLLAWMWHGAMDFDLYIPGIALPAFILLGALEGLTGSTAESLPTKPRSAGRIALALVCLVAIWPQLARVRAAYNHRAAVGLLAPPPNPHAAAVAMQRATILVPGDATFWDFLAVAHARAGRPEAAIAALERAVALDPHRPRYHWQLGLAFLSKDGAPSERAQREFSEARRLAPANPDYQKNPDPPR